MQNKILHLHYNKQHTLYTMANTDCTINVTKIEEVNKIKLVKKNDGRYAVTYGDTSKFPVLIMNGLQSYGLFNRSGQKNKSITISLGSIETNFLNQLKDSISKQIGEEEKVKDPVYIPSHGETSLFNVWLKNYKNKLVSEFYPKGKEESLDDPFKEIEDSRFEGLYVIEFTGVSKGKDGVWYPNFQLGACHYTLVEYKSNKYGQIMY